MSLLKLLVDPDLETSEGVSLYLGDATRPWLYAAILLVAAGFCLWTYRHVRGRVRPGLARLMIGARLLLLVLIFCLLFRPTLEGHRLRTPLVAMLVDV